ncbi:MAG: methyltransferase domain-containing protein [Planctomycetota bacterium]
MTAAVEPEVAGVDFARIGACPSCRSDLEAERSGFACRGCGRVWPVIDGVPRFVESEHYVENFGYEWRRHRKTQFDTARCKISEREFREKTGLTPDDVRGKLVLDVGVGTGRYADVVARWGGRVVGIDLSLAVLTARENLARQGERAFVAQADLFKLPFKEQTFDIVYSIGVLHHTPSTRAAFRTIARCLKPGGVAAIAVYRWTDFTAYASRYRRYTAAMSHGCLHFLSHGAIPKYHFLRASRNFLSSQTQSQLEKACFIAMHEDPAWRVLNTFDWYSPRYQWLHTEPEVMHWFEELGFEHVRAMPEPSMHSVRGVLPAGSELRTPPETAEERRNELTPPPAWVPAQPVWARDAVLTVLVLGAVLRALCDVRWWSLSMTLPREVITSVVLAAKRLLGIEGDILGRRSGGAGPGGRVA